MNEMVCLGSGMITLTFWGGFSKKVIQGFCMISRRVIALEVATSIRTIKNQSSG
jgi:hypothetical protein